MPGPSINVLIDVHQGPRTRPSLAISSNKSLRFMRVVGRCGARELRPQLAPAEPPSQPPRGDGRRRTAELRYCPSRAVEERHHVSCHAGKGRIEPSVVLLANREGVRPGRAVVSPHLDGPAAKHAGQAAGPLQEPRGASRVQGGVECGSKGLHSGVGVRSASVVEVQRYRAGQPSPPFQAHGPFWSPKLHRTWDHEGGLSRAARQPREATVSTRILKYGDV